MLKNLLLWPRFWRRRTHRPERYEIVCPRCTYAEDFELKDGVITAWRNAQGEMTAIPRDIRSLPVVCPSCGTKLRKKRATQPVYD